MTTFDDLHLPITRTPRMGRRRVMYVPNHRSFGAFMRSDQVRDPTEAAAKDIARVAAASGPDSSPGPKGGDRTKRGLHSRVKRGFKVKRMGGLMKVSGNLRVKVTITNNAKGSALIEFGGRGLAPTRALGRAGAMFGDFKPEGGPG